MRIQVVSDTHVRYIEELRETLTSIAMCEADVCLLVGDMCEGHDIGPLLDFLARRNPRKLFLFIPGNHEYYRIGPERLRAMLAKLARSFSGYGNVRVFGAGRIMHVALGVAFIGLCGFWDDSGVGRSADFMGLPMRAKPLISDHYATPGCVDADFGFAWGRHAKRQLAGAMSRAAKRGLDVVVATHSAPSVKSLHPKYGDSPINMYFVNDWEDLIGEHKPLLWAHGHTHTSFDYYVGGTRVVCNPHGYVWAPEDMNKMFSASFCVDVTSSHGEA